MGRFETGTEPLVINREKGPFFSGTSANFFEKKQKNFHHPVWSGGNYVSRIVFWCSLLEFFSQHFQALVFLIADNNLHFEIVCFGNDTLSIKDLI